MNRLSSPLNQRHHVHRVSVAGNTVSALVAACLVCVGCASTSGGGAHDATVEKARLDNFDDLDFNVFTHQKWDELGRSHAQDILVHWPDGHTTKGLAKHTEDMKGMFVFAPDYRVTAHTVKVAGGEWTSVIGVFEGTFTQPMPVGDGKTVPPNGQTVQDGDGHSRPLDEGWRHGRGVPLLGLGRIHEADRPRAVAMSAGRVESSGAAFR